MSNPSEINGGSALAMVGKDCVVIGSDLRMGLQSVGIANNFEKVFAFNGVHLALTGLATDVQTLATEFRKKHNLFELREERRMEPEIMANLVSSTLYSKRFSPYFVGPIVAGINSKSSKPFICSFDSIGCIDYADDFAVVGTASDQLYGMCESLWSPDLGPDELFEVCSQALTCAVDRDAISGWGALVYIIEKDKITRRFLKTRQD